MNPHGDEEDDDDDDDDSGTDHLSIGTQSCIHLQPAEPIGSGGLPAVFQTNHLVFYERFKAYQDYMLGNHRLISCFIDRSAAEGKEPNIQPDCCSPLGAL